MDDALDEFIRAARRCDRAAKQFETEPLKGMCDALREAAHEVGQAWSGSWLGYHASVYTESLRARRPGEHFDSEWGGTGSFASRTSGTWTEYDYDTVKEEIQQRSGVIDLAPIADAARSVGSVFDNCKAEILPLLDALIAQHPEDSVLTQKLQEISKLSSHISSEKFVKVFMPSGSLMSRDYLAVGQGLQVPLHLRFEVWVAEKQSYSQQIKALADHCRYVVRYSQQRYKMSGKTVARKDGKIFIGHGRSSAWRDLKDLIQDRLKLDWDEFNREPVAGITAIQRLADMLDAASFAFVVMTAEDEHADKSLHARENVTHEVGLFQGRLGFERAIILLEEECEEFSNIHGLQQLRFPKGNIKAITEDIRRVLEREGIL